MDNKHSENEQPQKYIVGHEKLRKGEGAIYGRCTGCSEIDPAQREENRIFLLSVIEAYENSGPNRKKSNQRKDQHHDWRNSW